MPKTLTAINPCLIAFTPRQVLLANPIMAAPKSSSLSEKDRTLLLLSIAQYLQKAGFSKTLKKFLSEAQLEKDGWKGSKLDMEEMCLKFLDKGNNAPPHSSGLNQDGKGKKKRKEDGENVVADQSGAADESVHANDSIKEKKTARKSSETLTKETQEVRPGEDNKKKDNKKKDHKSVPEPVAEEENQETETMPEQTTRGKSEDLTTSKGKNDASAGVEKKSKDKKKKNSKSTSDDAANDAEEKQDVEKSKPTEMDTEKVGSDGETLTSEVDKDSKPHKRKRLESEENDTQQIDTATPSEKSKRRKKEKKKEIASEQNSEVKPHPNVEVDLLESQKTPSKDQDTENGSLGKTAEKSAKGKAMKKQLLNGSAEPQSTTLKAFSRIKVDEVEFADERLKDNSYWAKDGAEVGYGAKAQEVLGQVRGRDFRHEKTKKKRGSYRGRIDQDSHSVKFNYSDEE